LSPVILSKGEGSLFAEPNSDDSGNSPDVENSITTPSNAHRTERMQGILRLMWSGCPRPLPLTMILVLTFLTLKLRHPTSASGPPVPLPATLVPFAFPSPEVYKGLAQRGFTTIS
jgi:hypothetical protein